MIPVFISLKELVDLSTLLLVLMSCSHRVDLDKKDKFVTFKLCWSNKLWKIVHSIRTFSIVFRLYLSNSYPETLNCFWTVCITSILYHFLKRMVEWRQIAASRGIIQITSSADYSIFKEYQLWNALYDTQCRPVETKCYLSINVSVLVLCFTN